MANIYLKTTDNNGGGGGGGNEDLEEGCVPNCHHQLQVLIPTSS